MRAVTRPPIASPWQSVGVSFPTTSASGSRWRGRLLTALSGDPAGAPPWVRALADGDDVGWFTRDGAVWAVHAGVGTLVAGIRALLLQAMHPGAMAGVHEWSRYRDDPIGRLTGTVRWVICTTYGSKEQAARERDRVMRFHDRVQGTYVDGAGVERRYSARDAELVEWVHVAFADAFLGAHETWGGPIPGGADAYVREWAVAGRLMGAQHPPESAAELRARIDDACASGVLRRDERVDDVVRFLRRAPFRGGMRMGYAILFRGAVATIPRRWRRVLGLRRSPWPVITASRIVLAVTARVLGTGPRAHDFALLRLARLRAAAPEEEPAEPESC